MSDYKESYAPDSVAARAAAQADADGAAAAESHALIPPEISLSPEYVLGQQKKFRELADRGAPGAQELFGVYLEDERRQLTATVAYGHFTGAARLATESVCRYDSLRGSLDQDNDVRSNFDLGKGTQKLTKSALKESDANNTDGSLTGAMHDWTQARRALVTANKRVKSVLFGARTKAEHRREKAAETELGEIESTIKTIGRIGSGVDVAISVITGSGHKAAVANPTTSTVLGAAKGYAAGGAKTAGVDVDIGSVAGVAKLGAQIYFAEDIAAAKTKIAASKDSIVQLGQVEERGEIEATMETLDQAVDQFERTAKVAEAALERRRRQFAEAGAKVDANAMSGGAGEGEVGESLLLGSAALEAGVLVDAAAEAGSDAQEDVTSAYNNTRARRAEYFTDEDTFEINGRRQYLPHGRTDELGDDPDITSLYQMQQAIKRWQTAATDAKAHLGSTKESFQAGIGNDAGIDEY